MAYRVRSPTDPALSLSFLLPFHASQLKRRSPRKPYRSTPRSARTGTPLRRRSTGRACAPSCAPSSASATSRTTTPRTTTSMSSGRCRLAMGSLRGANRRSWRRRRRSRPRLAFPSFGELLMASCYTGTKCTRPGDSLRPRADDEFLLLVLVLRRLSIPSMLGYSFVCHTMYSRSGDRSVLDMSLPVGHSCDVSQP